MTAMLALDLPVDIYLHPILTWCTSLTTLHTSSAWNRPCIREESRLRGSKSRLYHMIPQTAGESSTTTVVQSIACECNVASSWDASPKLQQRALVYFRRHWQRISQWLSKPAPLELPPVSPKATFAPVALQASNISCLFFPNFCTAIEAPKWTASSQMILWGLFLSVTFSIAQSPECFGHFEKQLVLKITIEAIPSLLLDQLSRTRQKRLHDGSTDQGN